jgi:hypothetical protein
MPNGDESRTRCSSFRFESTQSPLSICALSRTGIRGSASAGSGKSQCLRTALLSSASSAGLPFDNSVVAGALVPRMPAARSTAAACSSVGRGDGKKRQLNAPQTLPCRPSPAREVGRRRRASSETGNGCSGDARYGMRFGTRRSAPSAQTRCMSALQSNAGRHLSGRTDEAFTLANAHDAAHQALVTAGRPVDPDLAKQTGVADADLRPVLAHARDVHAHERAGFVAETGVEQDDGQLVQDERSATSALGRQLKSEQLPEASAVSRSGQCR